MGARAAGLVVAAGLSLVVAVAAVVVQLSFGSSPAWDRVPVASDGQAVRVDRGSPGKASLPALGVQYHATWEHYGPERREEVLDRIEASGATWVRVDIGWASLQPRPGAFDRTWALPRVDAVMEELRERDLKVLGMFWTTPAWASDARDPDVARFSAPRDPQDYADALGVAAQRWGDVVDAWEVWNEPNLGEFFRGADPATYTELLCAAHDELGRTDPRAPVVFGGLMYNDDGWLEQAYLAGAQGCFDVLSVHSYQAPADAPPATTDPGEVWNLTSLDAVHETMLENGDDLPVWVTEFGWSVHENAPGVENWRRGVTEEQQARYAAEAVQLVGERFPFVDVAFWYKDAADPTSSDEHQQGYALLDEDLVPRPVYDTLRDLYAGR